MIELQDYVGQVLDEKYRLERLLGQGGMGAVYLATHLGTERYVALKLITPQFMSNKEFVERFKREARAAGRLRHPNVVDVTDFGFTEMGGERLAYLVMEYLDGCTLGDVLSEEGRLPLEWVVDILEQVCSAVHEAHQQGIVHRDLKPENIWLEPNRLGGYRVKVLDFGIAKVAPIPSSVPSIAPPSAASRSTQYAAGTTATKPPDSNEGATAIYGAGSGRTTNITNVDGIGETDTLLLDDEKSSSNLESVQTKLFEDVGDGAAAKPALAPVATQGDSESDVVQTGALDDDRTLMFGATTRRLVAKDGRTTVPHGSELTRVGAIMGTPLYMSPEQCAGKGSDARSDLYSLGVIAYQMLAGEPPFTGETSKIMREHVDTPPVPLRERAKVPKRVASIVMSALAKDPADRPQSAQAFASALRAQADGIGSLYRRAFALYSEYFPKFLKLSLIAHVPVFLTTALLVIFQILERSQPPGFNLRRVSVMAGLATAGLLQIAAYFVSSSVISGVTAIIVTQVMAMPLRPVELRTGFAVMRRRWKPFLKTSIRVTIRIVLGWLLIIPGLIMQIRYALWAPVVLLEGLEKKAALKRSRELGSRSWRTIVVVSLLQVVIPALVGALIGRLSVKVSSEAASVSMKSISQHLAGLSNVIIIPLMSIVPALLYLKMRQLGGETLSELLAEIEDVDAERSQWQQRMRTRISLHSSRNPSGSTSRPSHSGADRVESGKPGFPVPP
jgi:serine/threonine protein kinase